MNDLISRQAAIDALAKFVPYAICDESTESYTNGLTDAYNLICQLPSAQPEQRWTPCSERLPKEEDCPMDCMVTRRSKFIGNYVDMAVAEADGTWTHEDWKAITIKGEATCISTRDADIVAWMPLPKPYREEKQNG